MNRFAFLLFLLLGVGCLADIENPPAGPERTQAEVEDLSPLPPEHPPIAGLSIQSRGSRRMSVDQLSRSIEAFGNLPAGSIVIPENLALSLGRPDYLQTTEENLDPTPLFMKFMMDLGGIICASLAADEASRPPVDRVFTRFADLEDNLRHAVLMTTGIDGAEATSYVERLTRVYNTARSSGGEARGYEAVCIALFTSPEFLLY